MRQTSRPLCQGHLGPVRAAAGGPEAPWPGEGPSGGLGVSHSSRDVRSGPPHDGSMHALKPAGLPGLGRDPAPPSAPWPCSPFSVAAAAETSSRVLSGIRITPPSLGSPRPTSTSRGPGPSCVAHPQGGAPSKGGGGGTGLGVIGASHNLCQGSPCTAQSLPGPWLT